MGQRSRTETVIAVLSAFHRRKKWTQAELARSVGVGTEALRKVLEELQAEAFPLVSETDHPHVYWKMSSSWCPGGILFKKEDVPELVRQLGRLPRSKARDGLLDVVVDQLPAKGKLLPVPPVASRVLSDQEEQYLRIVEDGAARKLPLFFRYVTASKGAIGERRASVHWIDLGPPARFVATCHRTGSSAGFGSTGFSMVASMPASPFDRAPPPTSRPFARRASTATRGRATRSRAPSSCVNPSRGGSRTICSMECGSNRSTTASASPSRRAP